MPAVKFTYHNESLGKKIAATIDGCPKAIDVVFLHVPYDVARNAPDLEEDIALVVIEYLSRRFPNMDIPSDVRRLPR